MNKEIHSIKAIFDEIDNANFLIKNWCKTASNDELKLLINDLPEKESNSFKKIYTDFTHELADAVTTVAMLDTKSLINILETEVLQRNF